MRKILLLAVTIVLAGCAGATAPGENVGQNIGSAVKYVHDADREVGCWFYVGTDGHASISCLPDSQYKVTK
jgi:hypothetical protein